MVKVLIKDESVVNSINIDLAIIKKAIAEGHQVDIVVDNNAAFIVSSGFDHQIEIAGKDLIIALGILLDVNMIYGA